MDANTYPSEPHHLTESRLWYGFTAAPAMWVIQELLGVIISAQNCPANLPGWSEIGGTGIKVLLALISLGLLAIAVSGGIVAYGNWRRLAGSRDPVHADGITREVFMSVGGILVSTAVVAGILWAGLPSLILNQCVRAL